MSFPSLLISLSHSSYPVIQTAPPGTATQQQGPWPQRTWMAGLEELKKKLQPLLFDDPDRGGASTRVPLPEETCDSYAISDGGTVNLLSRSLGEYNINEHGFHKRSAGPDESDSDEKGYRCASHEMHIFDPIGNGASSVVERAIFIPVHRILALKKINIFEKEKRQQILNEMRTLCEACCYPGLVEFQGAFYMPDSGQISIALEYMDGGSLADIIRVKKSIPEPVLSHMLQKVLLGLRYLHEVRHLVHRDIKPANLLVNLKGEAKITDFGVSTGLDNTMAMCATFVGTVAYMSPGRIRNENYSYAADIWSLGLTILECATGKFPYDVNEGPANLMLQILDDPSPTPPLDAYSSEFCSFINDCLQKDADARPMCEQLLSHPFIKRYAGTEVDLAAYVKSVVDPTERLKQIAEMLAIHYYLLFNGSDGIWHHMKTFYMEQSTFSFSGKVYVGQNDIFDSLSNIRKKLKGDRPREKIVHVVEKLHCRANGETGVAIRVSGSFIVGNQFLVCGDGIKAEGMPSMDELSIDIPSKRVGQFREQFIMQPGNLMSCYYISKQDLYIIQS
ncbi:mitogen-activated protein kinase kinase 3 isoform X1 [Miscanthus floridulus]|uniref:mitogen-activated protein kinase kinase 3 isoform X1 n=2 Tax=Miscanthus floridulus TaxID=154761 RepID=UPI003457CFD9